MKLSVIIPAHNEEDNLPATVTALHTTLSRENIEHELVVINDNSTDNTPFVLEGLKKNCPVLVAYHTDPPKHGFGYAIRKGFETYTGDCAAVFMSDLSDTPDELVLFFRTMEKQNCDCVFGSRFIKGGGVKNYPWVKLILNRIVNNLVRILFGIKYNDCTNAFKLYKRRTIDGLKPFTAEHFNLTLELPLKAIIRGYSYVVIPNSWTGRTSGVSSFKIKEMGSRYLLILKYCLLEKYFSKRTKRK